MCFGLVFPRVFLHQHANYLLYVQTIPGETCVKYPKGHSVLYSISCFLTSDSTNRCGIGLQGWGDEGEG